MLCCFPYGILYFYVNTYKNVVVYVFIDIMHYCQYMHLSTKINVWKWYSDHPTTPFKNMQFASSPLTNVFNWCISCVSSIYNIGHWAATLIYFSSIFF